MEWQCAGEAEWSFQSASMATGHKREGGRWGGWRERGGGGWSWRRRRQLEGLWGGGGWDVAAPNAEAWGEKLEEVCFFHSERTNTLANSNNGYGFGKLDIKITACRPCDCVLTMPVYLLWDTSSVFIIMRWKSINNILMALAYNGHSLLYASFQGLCWCGS